MADSDRRPDTFVINGVAITPRQLAEARQELVRRSPFNAGFYPALNELSQHEQAMSVLDAQNYLIALTDLVPSAISTPAGEDARLNPPDGDR